MTLPDGVELTPLTMHRDDRGWLTEIFREEWGVGVEPCQWTVTKSGPNVLRGIHVHPRHQDYLTVLQGRITVGLYDARPWSGTHRQSAMLEMSGDGLSSIRIPIGVMHGFYSHDASLFIYGLDAYYDPADELGCHWSDPCLGLAWPCRDPVLSERDHKAGSLAEVEAKLMSLGPELQERGRRT